MKIPVTSQYLKLIRELMGKKASIQGGREMVGKIPLSSCFTKTLNCTPIETVVAKKRY